MTAYLLDWLNLLIRWAHMVVGISWIGASFYFVWLDFSLRKRAAMNDGVYGTSWMVHGGGFYHVEKYAVAPAALPDDLHWFKWEAYLTWMTGFALLVVQYYFNASSYLIDPAVLSLEPWQAVCISIGGLVGGWIAYDALCRSPLRDRTGLLTACAFVLVCAAAWGFTHVFSGRGAFIHIGAFMGTIMAANVFMIIIPNQRIMVGDLLEGRTPDGQYGRIGKQRSLHNSYLTLPVLLLMISNHYPFLTSHPHGWLVVALVLALGGTVRHYMIRAEAGDEWKTFSWALPSAAVALLAVILVTAPEPTSTYAGVRVADADALAITQTHCVQCHAARPANRAFAEPPKGVRLDSIDGLRLNAQRIYAQAVQTHAMPLGNMTRMTPAERDALGAWIVNRQVASQ